MKKAISFVVCLCMLLCLGFPNIPKAMAQEQKDLFLSYPSASKFGSLWVGDTVVFESHYYEWGEALASGNSLTVLSGNNVEITDIDCGGGVCYKGLKFTKVGKATVKVAVCDSETEESAQRVFSFTVSERPSDKPVKVLSNSFPSKINLKIGDELDGLRKQYSVAFENLNYGIEPAAAGWTSGGMVITGDLGLRQQGGKGGYSLCFVGDNRVCDNVGWSDMFSFDESLIAACPGTLVFQPVYNGKNVGKPVCTIIVENPTIADNAPASAKVGENFKLTTSLKGTSLKNIKIADYMNEFENGWYYGNECFITYKPTVTVIEGEECITRSGKDYSHALATSEVITFKKAGTVKLKIKYSQFPEWIENYTNALKYNNLEGYMGKGYDPEKTVTVRVECKDNEHKAATTLTKATVKASGKQVTACKVCKKVIKTTVINKIKNVKLSKVEYTYSGKTKTPSVVVKDSKGKTLKKGKDYTVTYEKGRKNTGKYKVKVSFKGNYSGSKALSFKIVPKSTKLSKLTAGSKKLTVEWKKQSTQTSGYQVQYSTYKSFKSAKTVTVAGAKKTSKTVNSLKANKKYYVRVRTYKTVGGKKYYSAWSSAKSTKTTN